jgi:hypothetical protein
MPLRLIQSSHVTDASCSEKNGRSLISQCRSKKFDSAARDVMTARHVLPALERSRNVLIISRIGQMPTNGLTQWMTIRERMNEYPCDWIDAMRC